MDVNGNPVTTTTCGQVVCGQDDLTWVCTAAGFTYQGQACAADAASSSCSCSGTDVNGNPVTTTTCGQVVCGQDDLTWVCTVGGFTYQGQACGADAASSSCSCSGTDVNGNPVTTTTCGQAVCGADDSTWVCTVNGFAYQGNACAGEAGASSCNCSGTDVNGNPVTTTTCGQVVCGADDLTWVCTANGFDYQGNACGDAGGSGGADASTDASVDAGANTFGYTGSVQQITIPQTGNYTIGCGSQRDGSLIAGTESPT
jgi:hypothetical protein